MLLIELTGEAGAILEEVCDDLFPAQAEMMSALSGRDKQSLVRLLGKLQTHFGGASSGRGKSGLSVEVLS